MAKKGLFSKTPVAPAKKIAGTNPVGTVSIGSGNPRTVPGKPPTIHGLNTTPHAFKVAAVKGSQKYGQVAKYHRTSGNPNAHQVGLRTKP